MENWITTIQNKPEEEDSPPGGTFGPLTCKQHPNALPSEGSSEGSTADNSIDMMIPLPTIPKQIKRNKQ